MYIAIGKKSFTNLKTDFINMTKLNIKAFFKYNNF